MAQHELPALPYPAEALAPHIDAETMRIHHGKHHAAYVNNLNAALADQPDLQALGVEDLLRNINDVPESIRTAVRNNGGGHANHRLFWRIMSPTGGGQPTGALAEAIDRQFGGSAALQDAVNKAAATRFGSGWGWLVRQPGGGLAVYSTANQDSPLMTGDQPLLGIDVWEHAYYLNYQNRRPDYLRAWWNVVDWTVVGQLYAQAD